jgi:hypothetical protein
MNHRSFLLILLILGAGVTAPVLVHHRGAARIAEFQAKLAVEANQRGHLQQPRPEPMAGPSETNVPPPLSASEVSELARLRNEARQLRETLNQSKRLEREKRRIEQALQVMALGAEPENPTALLAEEMPIRRSRVAALHEWLEQNPKEKIPELRFLSEDSWIRSAERERVTDEDFERWVGSQRGNAEMRFSRLAQEALKAFARENNGNFPVDLAQLKPFFSTPIEDGILDRYQILPTKSLPSSLAEVGGDWAITQKAPIHPRYDSRLAISLKGRMGTVAEGRWDNSEQE